MDMPDASTLERWLKDPNMRDVAVATLFGAFVAYRTATMKGVIGKVAGVVSSRLDGKRIDDTLQKNWEAEKAYEAAMLKYKIEHSTWQQWRSLNAGIGERPLPIYILSAQQWFVGDWTLLNDAQKQAASIAYAEYVTSQNDLVAPRLAMIARWDEIYSHRDDVEPIKPDTPKDLWYLEPPTADEIAFAGMLGFLIAMKPELLTESLKGVGEIVKGIGEIIPF